MIAKIAILFTGMIIGAPIAMLYAMACVVVTNQISLDLTEALHPFTFPICLVAGYVTTFRLLRGAWTTPPLKKYAPRRNRSPNGESAPTPAATRPPTVATETTSETP